MNDNQQTSRDLILQKIKAGKPKSSPLPHVPIYDYPGHKIEEFTQHVSGFDGKVLSFDSRQQALQYLNENLDKTKKIFASVNDYNGNIF